jgi:hypothetical protein
MNGILKKIAAVALLLWLQLDARAHAPFDCTARVIVHPGSAEVMLTVGTTLGENFLRPAGVAPGQLPNGHPFALVPDFATNLFTVSSDGKIISAREADVITDGLEVQFHFEYALDSAKSLGLEAHFLPELKSPRAVPLVLTDENGNILASAVLSPIKTGTEFALVPSATAQPVAPQPPVAKTTPDQPPTNVNVVTAIIPAPATVPGPTPSFAEFLRLGIGHILNFGAFDHLLFLTALLLGCRKLKPMLLVITGFTLAHSVTLALAALNVVTISTRLVEPAIAASIIVVAAENFRRTEKPWHRYALTCGFGLIHGFGFASALRDSGLAGTGMQIAKPLLAFNLGVEIGQLTVAAALLPVLLLLERQPWFARHGVRVISGLVILVAAYWLWQRRP